MVVTDKKMIARNYIRTRFPVDLLATVEWDLLIRAIRCGGTCTGDKRWLNDVTALARMLKVLRLARAGPLISRLTAGGTAHSAYINAAKFFLYVIVVAHVLACLFYMIPILFECTSLHGEKTENGEVWNSNHTCMATSWRVNHGLNDVNNNVQRNGAVLAAKDRIMSTSSQYISALYWSLTTMTTIGYGDRVSEKSFEFCIQNDDLVFKMMDFVFKMMICFRGLETTLRLVSQCALSSSVCSSSCCCLSRSRLSTTKSAARSPRKMQSKMKSSSTCPVQHQHRSTIHRRFDPFFQSLMDLSTHFGLGAGT